MINDLKTFDYENQSQMAELAGMISITKELLITLIDKSHNVKDNSYSPYSKFRVGCSALAESGTIYVGTNVENVSFGATICAERSCIFTAVTNGDKKFKVFIVCTDMGEFIPPCGCCRQVMSEFSPHLIILMNKKKQCKLTSISDVLPSMCDISHLRK